MKNSRYPAGAERPVEFVCQHCNAVQGRADGVAPKCCPACGGSKFNTANGRGARRV